MFSWNLTLTKILQPVKTSYWESKNRNLHISELQVTVGHRTMSD